MHQIIVTLVAPALLLSACSTGQVASGSDATATSGQAGEAVEGQNDDARAATMSVEEAADWYAQAICTANAFGPVRDLALELAEVNQINVSVLRSAAPPYAASVEEARDSLLNPPAPWPVEVADLIDRRAQLLVESIDLASQWASIATPEDYLAWVDSFAAENREAALVVEDIRLMLGLSAESSCPEGDNPDVATALAALEEGRSATVLISCFGSGSSEDRNFFSLDQYWAALDDEWTVDFCSTEVDGFTPDTPTPEQREAMALYSERFEDGLDDEEAFSILIDYCIEDPYAAFSDMASARATLMFCPQSPNADVIRGFAEGSRIEDDGSYVVGEEISSGTWETTDSVSDCYWERSRPNGDTIANDFITSASGRVTVKVSDSDGSFTTEGCGSWERVQ